MMSYLVRYCISELKKQTKKSANTGSAIKAYLICKSTFKEEDYINISLTGTWIWWKQRSASA